MTEQNEATGIEAMAKRNRFSLVTCGRGVRYILDRVTRQLRRETPRSARLSKKERARIKREFHKDPATGKKMTKRQRAAMMSAEAKAARGADA